MKNKISYLIEAKDVHRDLTKVRERGFCEWIKSTIFSLKFPLIIARIWRNLKFWFIYHAFMFRLYFFPFSYYIYFLFLYIYFFLLFSFLFFQTQKKYGAFSDWRTQHDTSRCITTSYISFLDLQKRSVMLTAKLDVIPFALYHSYTSRILN